MKKNVTHFIKSEIYDMSIVQYMDSITVHDAFYVRIRYRKNARFLYF